MFTILQKNERLIVTCLNLLLIVVAFFPFVEVPTYASTCDECYDPVMYRGYESPFYRMIFMGATIFQLICHLNFQRNKSTLLILLCMVLVMHFVIATLGSVGFMSGMPYHPKLRIGYTCGACIYLAIVLYSWIAIHAKRRKNYLSDMKRSIIDKPAFSFVRTIKGTILIMCMLILGFMLFHTTTYYYINELVIIFSTLLLVTTIFYWLNQRWSRVLLQILLGYFLLFFSFFLAELIGRTNFLLLDSYFYFVSVPLMWVISLIAFWLNGTDRMHLFFGKQ